jgi:hypothetical protein
MRAIFVLTLTGVLLLGCQHSKSTDPAAAKGEPAPRKAAEATSKGAARSAATTLPRATAILESSGAVASVNTGLRFVVVDFHLNPLPKIDQRMGVYRQGLKVGEVRISNHSYSNLIAADIMAGEAMVGDMVRPD